MQSGGGKPAEGLDAATTAAIGKDEDGACFTARKKLWVDGRRLDRPPRHHLPLSWRLFPSQEKSPGSRRGFSF